MVFRQVLTALMTTAVLGSSAAALVNAEAQQGRVTGVVRDASGGVLPGAVVTLSTATSAAPVSVTAGPDGSFSVGVAPGTYTVTASMAGFRRAARTVTVAAGTSPPVEFALEVSFGEEVTVTAMKREQMALDVPFSIAAPTERQLRERGAQDIEGVAANVGGFTVQNLGPGQSQVAMRGVSAGQIVRDQPGVKEQVGTYLDESVISLSLFTPDLDLFDTNRIEVLRGPQGTLFGSGSLAGTVRYITNQPSFGVTEGFAELGASAVSGGSFGANAKFGFNAPLGDRAAVRVAAYTSRLPGFIDAVQPGLSVDEDVNDGMRSGVRAAVKIAVNDRLVLTPRLVYQRVK